MHVVRRESAARERTISAHSYALNVCVRNHWQTAEKKREGEEKHTGEGQPLGLDVGPPYLRAGACTYNPPPVGPAAYG